MNTYSTPLSSPHSFVPSDIVALNADDPSFCEDLVAGALYEITKVGNPWVYIKPVGGSIDIGPGGWYPSRFKKYEPTFSKDDVVQCIQPTSGSWGVTLGSIYVVDEDTSGQMVLITANGTKRSFCRDRFVRLKPLTKVSEAVVGEDVVCIKGSGVYGPKAGNAYQVMAPRAEDTVAVNHPAVCYGWYPSSFANPVIPLTQRAETGPTPNIAEPLEQPPYSRGVPFGASPAQMLAAYGATPTTIAMVTGRTPSVVIDDQPTAKPKWAVGDKFKVRFVDKTDITCKIKPDAKGTITEVNSMTGEPAITATMKKSGKTAFLYQAQIKK